MKTLVRYIGVTDKDDRVHAVKFTGGVNVITGRSSTGKSALIEIFDYCFGNDDYTVPEGVITDCAHIYFVVMQIEEAWVVLARREDDSNHAFIKQEYNEQILSSKNSFTTEYFDDDYFRPSSEFRKILRGYFGANIQITDVDESQEAKRYRGNRKKSTPSIRSFTSFMLQHQNLVANKHAIFYRFDEKEKREQVIEHFKVFAGFADQEYFLKVQELENLKIEERQLAVRIPKQSDVIARKKQQISDAVVEYIAVSGLSLELGDLDLVIAAPQMALDRLQTHRVDVIAVSEEHSIMREYSKRKLAELTAKLRKQQNAVKDIESSIEFAENYSNDAKDTLVPQQAELHASQCPFCNSYHNAIEECANDLESAINWLNAELRKSRFSLDSFREDLVIAQVTLKELNTAIQAEQGVISGLDKQIEELERYRTQHELAVKAKVKIENHLEELLENPSADLERQLKEVKIEIKAIERDLKERYNIKQRLVTAEAEIATYMAEITPQLDFEESFKPIHLHFSLETFDLWNDKNGRKVFLRSMGSGANWLSCHVSLFLALNRYFCELGDRCAIPTTLFFDQPSQVYFPAILDLGEKFSAEEIAKKEGAGRTRKVDDDLQAVTQLYAELVRYCNSTQEMTGIEPQIIVTDHADKLDLHGDGSEEAFENLVNGRRWRASNSGFIQRQEADGAEAN